MALAWLAVGAAQAQTLGTAALLVGPAAGTNSVVLAVTGAWTNTANTNWLHLPGNSSGSGSANVVFSYDPNSGTTRSGTLTIAGQTLTVTQAGATYLQADLMTNVVSAGLNEPYGVAADGAGNVYIADTKNSAIRKWTATNNAMTGLVTSGLHLPTGVAVDIQGNVYIADTGDSAVKKWSAASGTVTTLVASGLTYPYGVAVDGAGNVYIADTYNNAIKKWAVANSNTTTLVASNLNTPQGVAVDGAGNVYIADTDNSAIKKWSAANSNVTTLVSSGLSYPSGVAVDGTGNVYIADTYDSAIKVWTSANINLITLVSANLSYPHGVALDRAGNVYAADTLDSAVKERTYAFVDPTTRSENGAAGNDALPAVLPTAENLLAPFNPTTDQSWLSISGVSNGVVSFSFTANNTGAGRTAHISLLGQAIPVTQSAQAPLATTQAATGITSSNATLNASVNPEGVATTVYFIYGASTNYGNTNVVSNSFNGTSALSVSAIVTNLSPTTVYYFQALASNNVGVVLGGVLTFTNNSDAAYFLGTTSLVAGPAAESNSAVLAVKPQTGA